MVWFRHRIVTTAHADRGPGAEGKGTVMQWPFSKQAFLFFPFPVSGYPRAPLEPDGECVQTLGCRHGKNGNGGVRRQHLLFHLQLHLNKSQAGAASALQPPGAAVSFTCDDCI